MTPRRATAPQQRAAAVPAMASPAVPAAALPVASPAVSAVAVPTGPGERPLTDQGRERRQQLLDTAARLFAERGYADTRVIDICDDAGVAKGLFYWYFENKEALFADLVRTMRLRLRRAQAEHVDPASDPLTRLRRGAEASVRFMAEHAAYFALLETASRDRTVAALLREGNDVHLADTTALVKEAQSAGQIPDDLDAELVGVGVNAAVSHFSHYHRAWARRELHGSPGPAGSVDELAAFAGEWVVRAVGGSPQSAAAMSVAASAASSGRPNR